MSYVYDFCGSCAEGTTVKLSFYDVISEDFIATVILNDAKTGCKTLSAVCGYSYIDYFYVSADVVCVKALVHKEDM